MVEQAELTTEDRGVQTERLIPALSRDQTEIPIA